MRHEIQAIIDNRVQGVKNKDVNQATRDYSPEVILFDIVDPLERQGIEAVKSRLQEWLASLAEIKNFEIQNSQIQAADDIAFVISFNHIDAVNTNGNQLNMWWRETTCYRKMNGKWQITHAHSSVPFNPQDGQASLGLKPERMK
ncbi:YybH family protein [Adhaeribacter pallidiroseus]|uniref:SnoaL-like domain-containing protein n=1 Tax=Adhaeribacter pallidiroseus TaxID=2072847 RepID=A0A369Q2R0_9BACT|nr:nuclear transport factor 2 family protein [Adhaeribacter pallidiroseus]RDC58802.1 hypothetical protein AHMF7616_05236 [Adhaeribacter pallidiroseus]